MHKPNGVQQQENVFYEIYLIYRNKRITSVTDAFAAKIFRVYATFTLET